MKKRHNPEMERATAGSKVGRGVTWLRRGVDPGPALAACVFLGAVLLACAGPDKSTDIRFGASHAASIPYLDDCDDFGTNPLELDPDQPLNVLVHGCASSSARLQSVAGEFKAAGQQAVCFSYDERDTLDSSSVRLRQTLRLLESHQRSKQLTLLAHSMGGLVARHALVNTDPDTSMRFRLAAVSTPFSGIQASRDCGRKALHVLSLGISVGVCQIVTGSKWAEIHPGSEFTRAPGALPDHVTEHLQIVTDEEGSCRRWGANGECERADFVFSIEEQTNPAVDSDPRVTRVVAMVGHAEVIGLEGRPPVLLTRLLREHAILRQPTLISTVSIR